MLRVWCCGDNGCSSHQLKNVSWRWTTGVETYMFAGVMRSYFCTHADSQSGPFVYGDEDRRLVHSRMMSTCTWQLSNCRHKHLVDPWKNENKLFHLLYTRSSIQFTHTSQLGPYIRIYRARNSLNPHRITFDISDALMQRIWKLTKLRTPLSLAASWTIGGMILDFELSTSTTGLCLNQLILLFDDKAVPLQRPIKGNTNIAWSAETTDPSTVIYHANFQG